MPGSTVRQVVSIYVRYEIPVLLLLAPVLLFPNQLSGAALGVLVATWLARLWAAGTRARRTPLDWPLALYGLMALLGTWLSVDPAFSWPKLLGLLYGLAVYDAVVRAVRSWRALWLAAELTVLLGLAMALVGFLGANWFSTKIFSLQGLYERLPRLITGAYSTLQSGFHPNEVAGVVTLFLPLSLALLWIAWRAPRAGELPGGQGWLRAALVVVVLVQAITLLLTQSRSALAGLVAGCGLLLLIWQWRLIAAAPLVGLGLAWLLRTGGLAIETLPGSDPANLIGRVDLWGRGLLAVRDFPLTGIGLGMYRRLAIAYYPFFQVDPVLADVGHAHNIFLQTALDMGIPGLVAYLAVLFLAAVLAWQAYNRLRDWPARLFCAGLASGLLAYHTFGMLDAVAPGARPSFAIWLFFGLLIAVYNVSRSRDTETGVAV